MDTFRIGRAQIYAGLLLLFFLVQGYWLVENRPPDPRDYSAVDCGRALWNIYDQGACEHGDSAMASRAAASPLIGLRRLDSGNAFSANESIPTNQLSEWDLFRFAPWMQTAFRAPFLIFGAWLGGGLWWVTRRQFGTAGGVVALALYCTSPWILNAAGSISPEIIAAWGSYGAVYTAIGIGHTILAPLREWRFRILLLGAALGFTLAAVPVAFLVTLMFCALFLAYLAEERRWQALGVLAVSAVVALLVAFLCTGWRLPLVTSAVPRLDWRWIVRFFSQGFDVPLYVLVAVALATYLGWKRARYFGNWAPLLVAALVPFVAVSWRATEPLIWTLPFLFTFVGGIFADLFESNLRKPAIAAAVLLIAAQAWMGHAALAHAVAMSRVVGGQIAR